ncbi:MAG: hypothetical protein LC689_06275, partial [Myxococcales bacterium]|nr:hypothetical protein [Myxococcales bacterium]
MPIAIAAAILAAWAPGSQARVVKIVVDRITPLTGQNIPYETVIGRAWGELDPKDSHNALITDIALAPTNTNGMVEYIASFVVVKPVDLSLSSHLLWHDVPNRGGRIIISTDLRNSHDIGLSSGWQGDNAGGTTVPANADQATPITTATTTDNEWVKAPVLAGVTGRLTGRIVNRNGLNAAPLNVMGNPIPYFPANVNDNSGDVLKVHLKETVQGVITEGETIANSDWKFCGGGTFDAPLPVTKLPVNVCLKSPGFDATKLYQLVYTVKDPYVLGAGTAAFRDLGSFFRYATADQGNFLAGNVQWAIIRGSSQSGNFTRHLIFLGMNGDEQGRIVHDGAWPLIAGRRVSNNSRWGQPDGVLELYQMGSEGPQWWHNFPDRVRNIQPGGILDRCSANGTCPKIVETFGGSEVFALKMTTSWVGTDPKNDIPLPDNVRRYYLPSSTHGGGGGGFNEAIADNAVNCPGNNWGHGMYRANPVPATQMVNLMRVALRDWVMTGKEPPPSIWPRMRGPKNERTLVDSNKDAMGFPSGVPGVPDSIFSPDNFTFPILDYDWGNEFDEFNATGTPNNQPPPIKAVVKMMVPKVDSDGNELGGIPTVLRDAPLGTYLGWNLTAGPTDGPKYDGRPFHAGQVCNYVGGMIPFFKTKAQRLAANDPRPSLEERYGTHAGYVA